MAKVRGDLRWEARAKEFSSLNTRDAETNTQLTEIVQVSNMSFEELGAMKKINGNEEVSNFDFNDINSSNKTVEYTYTTPGTYNIILESSAVNIIIQSLVMISGGGGGGYLQYRAGRYKGTDGGATILAKDGSALYTVTGGGGGNSCFGSANYVAGGGGGSGGFQILSDVSVSTTGTLTVTVGIGGSNTQVAGPAGSGDLVTGGAGGSPNGYAGGNGTVGNNENFAYYGGGGGGLGSVGSNGTISASGALTIAGGTGNGTYGGAGGSSTDYLANPGQIYGGGGAGGAAAGAGQSGYCYIRINYDY